MYLINVTCKLFTVTAYFFDFYSVVSLEVKPLERFVDTRKT